MDEQNNEQINEQPIVSLNTRVDFEDYRAFYWFATLRGRRRVQLCVSAAITLAMLGFAAWWLYGCFVYGETELLPHGLFFVACAVFLIVVRVRMPRIGYKRMLRVSPEPKGRDYAFYEDHLVCSAETAHGVDQSTARYEKYAAAIETVTAFYLEINEKPARYVVIPKRYLAPEQIEQLRGLLMRKFGEKFKGMK